MAKGPIWAIHKRRRPKIEEEFDYFRTQFFAITEKTNLVFKDTRILSILGKTGVEFNVTK